VYSLITELGLELDAFLGSHSIAMLLLCGGPSQDWAWIFDSMPRRSMWTWSLSMDALVKTGRHAEASKLFGRMDLRPNGFVLVSALKACGDVGDGRLLHAHVLETGMEIDAHVGNALITMYGELNCIGDASSVFTARRRKDIVAWNAIIAAFVHNGHGREAMEHFRLLQRSGDVQPSAVTFVNLLKACSISAPDQAAFAHVCIVKSAFESNAHVGTMLVDMYAKRGSLEDARRTFERLSKADVAVWNVMISGLIAHERFEEALHLFAELPKHNVEPNNVTLVAVLQACADAFILDGGMHIHGYIVRNSIEIDAFLGSSLVDIYARCGDLGDARNTFDRLNNKHVASWNAVMSGYTQHELGWEALCLFGEMCRSYDCTPDEATFVTASKACSTMSMLESGRCIHSHIAESGHESNTSISNTLIDLYSRCGRVEDARHVFGRIPRPDIWAWNAMISCMCRNGGLDLASDCLKRMTEGGLDPMYVTIIPMLARCSQQGQLDDLFQTVRELEGIVPTVEVYNCIVDALGRAGCLHSAEEILLTIPFGFNILGWMSLLTNCKTHRNMGIGAALLSRI
jgi:pentatricopeptide repeat protein